MSENERHAKVDIKTFLDAEKLPIELQDKINDFVLKISERRKSPLQSQ